MKIICLHHAGGNGFRFYSWKKHLEGYQVFTLDLSGHGSRIQEPLLYDFDMVVHELTQQVVLKTEDDEAYVLFGHSMGGLMILHILDRLEEQGKRMPEGVILSGASVPEECPNRKKVKDMSEDEFLNMIYEQGGTSREIIETEEFRECFLPIIRADYTVLDEKKLLHRTEKFTVKAVIFNGEEDLGARGQEEKLKTYFEGEVPVVHFKGGHFYFDQQVSFVCEQIRNYIEKNFREECIHATAY